MPALRVDEALGRQHPCFGRCHETLTLAQRTRAIEVVYDADDALRGWGYEPLYDVDGDRLWREAQRVHDPAYRGVAVRFGECIYRRLVGSMLHELLHAVLGGQPGATNHGIPFGLPYGVPESVPEAEVEAYLAPYNFAEARAFVGVWILAGALGIDWKVLNATDQATLCFPGGNAVVPPLPGYRAVPHVDPVHHAERYRRLSGALEAEARAWFTPERLSAIAAAIDEAAARGRQARPGRSASPEAIAALRPEPWTRNDPCPCRSGKKVKKCCGEADVRGRYGAGVA